MEVYGHRLNRQSRGVRSCPHAHITKLGLTHNHCVNVPTGNTYNKYATKNPIEAKLVARFLSRFDELLPNTNVARILEVGTGEGHVAARVTKRYPNAFLAAVDLRDDQLAAQWRSVGLAASFALGESLPFPDQTFDFVMSVEVLEHVSDPAAVLAELARVAKGPVVLTVPNEPIWRIANMGRGKYLRQLGNTPGHINHWSTSSFRRLVEQHLTVTSCVTSFPWMLVGARSR